MKSNPDPMENISRSDLPAYYGTWEAYLSWRAATMILRSCEESMAATWLERKAGNWSTSPSSSPSVCTTIRSMACSVACLAGSWGIAQQITANILTQQVKSVPTLHAGRQYCVSGTFSWIGILMRKYLFGIRQEWKKNLNFTGISNFRPVDFGPRHSGTTYSYFEELGL